MVNLQMVATEIHKVSLLRISCFVSLDKYVLVHCRYLMLKFSEILVLVCRKIFSSVFIQFCAEIIPIAVVSILSQNLIFFSVRLVLYDRKHSCSILTNLSNLSQAGYHFCFIKHSLKF